MAKIWRLIENYAFGAVVRSVDYYRVTKLNIYISSDLDGQVVDLKTAYFKAKEVQDSSTSEYRKQTYIFEDVLYYF